MLPQQYCLRWKYHHSNLQTMFSQLLDRGCFCDVTLACEGQLIRAHRVVLCACSTFFDTVLTNYSSERDPIIIMKDVTFADVKCLIEFMYKGEINVEHAHLPSLLKTADDLKIKGLAEVSWRDDDDINPPPPPATEFQSTMHEANYASERRRNSPNPNPNPNSNQNSNSNARERRERRSSSPHTERMQTRMPLLTPLPLSSSNSVTIAASPMDHYLGPKRKRGRPPLDDTYDVFNLKMAHYANIEQQNYMSARHYDDDQHPLASATAAGSSSAAAVSAYQQHLHHQQQQQQHMKQRMRQRQKQQMQQQQQLHQQHQPSHNHSQETHHHHHHHHHQQQQQQHQHHQQQPHHHQQQQQQQQSVPLPLPLPLAQSSEGDDTEQEDVPMGSEWISTNLDASTAGEMDKRAHAQDDVLSDATEKSVDVEQDAGLATGLDRKKREKSPIKKDALIASTERKTSRDETEASKSQEQLQQEKQKDEQQPSQSQEQQQQQQQQQELQQQEELQQQRQLQKSPIDLDVKEEHEEEEDELSTVPQPVEEIESVQQQQQSSRDQRSPALSSTTSMTTPIVANPKMTHGALATGTSAAPPPPPTVSLHHSHGHGHGHGHGHSHSHALAHTHGHGHAHTHGHGHGHAGHYNKYAPDGYMLNEHGMLMAHDFVHAPTAAVPTSATAPSSSAAAAAAVAAAAAAASTTNTVTNGSSDNDFMDLKLDEYDAADMRLTSEEMSQWQDVIKMDDYLAKGRRPQFWEEPFTKRVLDAIKNKRLEMKKASRILGVSYGTLYGRYREVYGCLKHPYSNSGFRNSQSSNSLSVAPRFDLVWPSTKRDASVLLQGQLEIGKLRPKDFTELWARPQM